MKEKIINGRKHLEEIKEEYRKKQQQYDYSILICPEAGCISSNCGAVKDALIEALAEYCSEKAIDIKLTGCMDTCNIRPAMIVKPGDVFYCNLNPENMEVIIQKDIIGGEIVKEYCFEPLMTKVTGILHLSIN